MFCPGAIVVFYTIGFDRRTAIFRLKYPDLIQRSIQSPFAHQIKMNFFQTYSTCLAGLLLSFVWPVVASSQESDQMLRPNDRIAIIGGTLAERMQGNGLFEAQLQLRRPEWKLIVRNVAMSGDDVHGYARKRFDSPEKGYSRLISDIELAAPTVVLVMYGFSEASDGKESVELFETGLRKLVASIKEKKLRAILVTPFSLSGYRRPDYEIAMSLCREVVVRVAMENGIPSIEIDWKPTESELLPDQLLVNERGYSVLADKLAEALVGGTHHEYSNSLLQTIVRKNEWFFHRYRPQNETYLTLFRKHEQGNNAAELPEFEPFIAKADEEIWARASEAQ